MPALDIADGYTLSGSTQPVGGVVVNFRFRPALWPAIGEYRRTIGTAAEEQAAAKFVAGHLVSWDVAMSGQSAPISVETVKRLPEPIFDQIFSAVSQWAPQHSESAAGNLLGGVG